MAGGSRHLALAVGRWCLWLLATGVEGVNPDRGPGYNLSALVINAAVDG